LIKQGISKEERFAQLQEIALYLLQVLGQKQIKQSTKQLPEK